MLHSSQPLDRPDDAFQPAPEQSAPWYCTSHGCSSCQPSGQDSPVSLLVWPIRSGAVDHMPVATLWISTNTKSHAGSVS